jgi:hypothetical protein
MRCGDYMKLGHSTHPESRLSGIQVDCPYQVTLLGYMRGCRRVEADMHRLLLREGLRHRGEWFKFDQQSSDAIIEVFGMFGSAKAKRIPPRKNPNSLREYRVKKCVTPKGVDEVPKIEDAEIAA